MGTSLRISRYLGCPILRGKVTLQFTSVLEALENAGQVLEADDRDALLTVPTADAGSATLVELDLRKSVSFAVEVVVSEFSVEYASWKTGLPEAPTPSTIDDLLEKARSLQGDADEQPLIKDYVHGMRSALHRPCQAKLRMNGDEAAARPIAGEKEQLSLIGKRLEELLVEQARN